MSRSLRLRSYYWVRKNAVIIKESRNQDYSVSTSRVINILWYLSEVKSMADSQWLTTFVDHWFSYANSISRNSLLAAVSRKLAVCWSKATFAGANWDTEPVGVERSLMQKLWSLAIITIKCFTFNILIDNGPLSNPHFLTMCPNAISICIHSWEAKKLKLSYLGRLASAPL